MTKKTYVDGFVFVLLNIYRRHPSPPVRKMCSIPNLPLIGEKYYHLFKEKISVVIFEIYTVMNLI